MPEVRTEPPAPPVAQWILERCPSERFPYRLQIMRLGKPLLILRCQARWPGAATNVFCLRETEPPDNAEHREEIDRVAIVALNRRGVRLTVILDRPRYKRCDFLILQRPYKDRPAQTYEQIYWQTQQSLQARRAKVRPLALKRVPGMNVRIAPDERYPWTFPEAAVASGRLAAGDYALMDGEEPLAVVERKTFENLLANFGVIPALHQHLVELSALPHHAFVVEAPYEDFLSTRRLHHFSPSFCAAAIAELYAVHPRLRVVFCANRKTANAWTRSYFAAVWAGQGRRDEAKHASTRHRERLKTGILAEGPQFPLPKVEGTSPSGTRSG